MDSTCSYCVVITKQFLLTTVGRVENHVFNDIAHGQYHMQVPAHVTGEN